MQDFSSGMLSLNIRYTICCEKTTYTSARWRYIEHGCIRPQAQNRGTEAVKDESNCTQAFRNNKTRRNREQEYPYIHVEYAQYIS